MRIASAAVALAALSFVTSARAADCGPPLAAGGVPISLSLPLNEPDRLALGRSIREAWIAGPGDIDKLEQTLSKSAPCTRSTFTAGGRTFALSGGKAPAPARWAMSPDGEILFLLLLTPTRSSAGAPAQSFLFSLADGKVFVVQAYRGIPGDNRVVADANASFSPQFSPLAMVEPHGDAVDIFRNTGSGLGTQIFAQSDRPYSVSFDLVDGHFFTLDPTFDARMRGSGMPCPGDLGQVKLTARSIGLRGDDKLDLACQYRDEAGSRVTVFATLTLESLDKVFAKEVAHYREPAAPGQPDPVEETRTVDLPWVRATPGRFSKTEAWRYDQGQGYLRAHWAGMLGRYIVQVHAIWNPEDEKAIRLATGILDELAFGPRLKGR